MKYTKPQLTERLRKVFNEFIRLRDSERPCISCGERAVQQAGHYYHASRCPKPSMRFNEKNVNGQCTYCNYRLAGNIQGYREGLIKKYGTYVITELDIIKTLKQNPWTHFEYQTMIDYYKNKVKYFEKED